MVKIIKAHGNDDMNRKMQEWVDAHVYDDIYRKFREDKGSYKGHPALFIDHGEEVECIVYDANVKE